MSKGFISKLFGGGEGSPSREKAIVRRDDLFRSAFEQAPVGIAFAGTDGQWLQFNDRFVKMLGFPKEELLRTSMRELTHAEDRKIEAPHVRRLTTGEIEAYTIDKRLLLRSRKYGNFRVSVSRCSKGSGELEYYEYVVAPNDATAPREGAGWLERVIEQVEDFAVIRATQEGTISGWSRGAEKIFGYKASEVLTRPRTVLYRDADAFEKKHEEELRQAMRTGLFNAESWRVGKDGFAIWTHVTLVTVRQEDGRVEIVEIVRQPSHVRSNPAHEAFRLRSEQLLTEARKAQEALQKQHEGAIEEYNRDLAALRAELKKREGVEQTLRESFAELSAGSEETYRELKIMADALKKEIARRRELELLLSDARSEFAAANDQWQEELQSFIEKQEAAASAAPEPVRLPLEAPEFNEVDQNEFHALFVSMEEEARSGTLLCRHGSVEIRVHLHDGFIVACTSNQPGMPLGEMLVDRGIISDDDRNRALEIQRHTNIAFGRVLLLLNAVSHDQLIETMTERTQLELAQLFGWERFACAFTTQETPAAKLVPLRLRPVAVSAWLVPSAPVSSASDEDDTLIDVPAAAESPADSSLDDTVTAAPLFVGNASKRARKLHRAECRSVSKIPAKSRVTFTTIEGAKEEGFELCSLCFKERKTPKAKKAAPSKNEKAPRKARSSRKKTAAEETPAADVN